MLGDSLGHGSSNHNSGGSNGKKAPRFEHLQANTIKAILGIFLVVSEKVIISLLLYDNALGSNFAEQS